MLGQRWRDVRLRVSMTTDRWFLPPATFGCVGNSQHDDAPRARQDQLRIKPLSRLPRQVGHFAVAFGREPLLEAGPARRRLGRSDPAEVKAQFQGALLDRALHGSRIEPELRGVMS